MTCIIVNMESWNEIVASHDHVFKLVEGIANTENPFGDKISVIFDKYGEHSIVDLTKEDYCWSAHLYVPKRPDLFLYCDEISADPNINQWRFKHSEKNHKISDKDAKGMRAGVVQAIQVLYYINNRDTYFVKPQRHIRRQLQRSAESLKEQKDFYILDLLGAKYSRSSDSNGEGAGKRYHLRRGHYSTYHTKKGTIRKWIKPVWCGDETLGRINKTYKV